MGRQCNRYQYRSLANAVLIERCLIKRAGHSIVTVLLTIGVCMAAYGFLAAYALHGIHLQQLSEQERQLQTLTRRQQELVRQRHLLTQVNAFDQRVAALDLQRRQWLFYQVNVQGHFSYDAAQQIIEQCADSALAYYWPIALEIRYGRQESERRRPGAPGAVQGDVHLTVKGRFVAKKE